MDESNFQAFLADQRARGALDSSGGFTVNFSKAKLKLAKYQLEDPAGYLLKFVQAGVQLGARRIQLRCQKEQVSVHLVNPKSEITPRDFLEMLQDPVEELRQLWQQTLATALRAAPTQTITFLDNETGHSTVVTDKIMVEEAPKRLMEGGGYTFHFTRENASTEALGEESKTVWTRCQLCPVPVVFDGVTVNMTRQKVPFYEDLLRDSSFFAGEVHRVETDRSGLGAPRDGRRAAITFIEGTRFQSKGSWYFAVSDWDSKPPKRRPHLARSLVVLPASLLGPSRLTLVQYGVILETRSVDLGCPGAEAAICVDGFATDLSGLKIRDSVELDREVDQVRGDVKLLLNKLEVELWSVEAKAPPPTRATDSNTAVGFILGGIAGFATIVFTGPFGSILMSGVGALVGSQLASSKVIGESPPPSNKGAVHGRLKALQMQISTLRD